MAITRNGREIFEMKTNRIVLNQKKKKKRTEFFLKIRIFLRDEKTFRQFRVSSSIGADKERKMLTEKSNTRQEW